MKKTKKALQFFITSNCNFRCKTCFGGFQRGNNLSLELFKKAVDQMKPLGYDIVEFTGGEPAVHPQFEEMVDYVVKKGLYFSFISNGSLLDRYKFIIKLYKKKLYLACFSVDGASAETHDHIRQKGSFKKVIDSIKYFLSQKTLVAVEVCLNSKNQNQIKRIIELLRSVGVRIIIFSSVLDTGFNKQLVLSDRQKATCTKKIILFTQTYPDMDIEIRSGLHGFGGVNFCYGLNQLSTFTVGPKGNTLYCTVTRFDGMNLGSLQNSSLRTLFNRYKRIATNVKKIRKQMLKKGCVPVGFNTCEYCNLLLKEYYQKA